MSFNSQIVAALTLAMTVLFSGCGKESSAPDPASPEVYMNDPEFRAQLKERRMNRGRQMEERLRLSAELKSETEKDPESDKVKELQSLLKASEEQAVNDRRETYRLVRERLLKKDGGNK